MSNSEKKIPKAIDKSIIFVYLHQFKRTIMKKVILAVSVLILSACNLGSTIANTTEEVANKTATKAGEIIGGSTRGFADGVGEGLDKAGNSFIKLSEDLSKKGIKLGGHKLETLSGNDNKISIYFISTVSLKYVSSSFKSLK